MLFPAAAGLVAVSTAQVLRFLPVPAAGYLLTHNQRLLLLFSATGAKGTLSCAMDVFV